MGGSLQCELPYATFCIDGKNVKVRRESRVPYMMVHIVQSNEDMTCFVDTGINAFRVEDSLQEKKEQPTLLYEEVEKSLGDDNLWTMYFDGA